MSTARLYKKGQITIPKAVREAAGLKIGERVMVEAIVDEPAFDAEHRDALRAAAGRYRTRASDLHDCLLDAVAQQRHTRVLSFDRDLHKLGHAERP